MKLLMLAFVVAFTAANLIVKYFGAYGLLFSSFLLIPFDFVARCIIHEKYRGGKLIGVLFLLTLAAALITYATSWKAQNIALASVVGFSFAQLAAGIFYQAKKQSENWFVKVNVSDLIAIVFDSIAFQLVAFLAFNPFVTFGQIAIKLAGGFLWYFIIFKKLKLHERILNKIK